MAKLEALLCRACMSTYVGEHVCEASGKAVYHIALTVEVGGEPNRLEDIGAMVTDRVKATGMRVVNVNARWVNHRECCDPNYRPPKAKRRAAPASGKAP